MKNWKWQLAIALLVVFLAGGACGFFLAARHEHLAFLRRHAGPPGERMRHHLERTLQLTPKQASQVGPIIDRAAQQLEDIRRETNNRVAQTMSQAHSEIVPFLSPDQQERLEEMKRRRQQMLHPPEPPPDAP